jgi:hypothetical protein
VQYACIIDSVGKADELLLRKLMHVSYTRVKFVPLILIRGQ